jgi:hypothetical protein
LDPGFSRKNGPAQPVENLLTTPAPIDVDPQSLRAHLATLWVRVDKPGINPGSSTGTLRRL